MFEIFSLIFFAFAFAFALCELALILTCNTLPSSAATNVRTMHTTPYAMAVKEDFSENYEIVEAEVVDLNVKFRVRVKRKVGKRKSNVNALNVL